MSKTPTEQTLDLLVQAVDEESKEAERTGREVRLERGERTNAEGSRFVYRFPLKRALSVRHDSSCTLTVRGGQYPALVVSASHDQITLCVTSDLGSSIRGATMRTDESPLLRQLAYSLRALQASTELPGWNPELASSSLSGSARKLTAQQLHFAVPEDLTDDQRAALRVAQSNAVTYLWGPPGTGKTVTLAALTWGLFCAHHRVLVVSHTHRAVDGVLEALCRRVSPKGRSSIPENSILRLGTIVRPSLDDEYGPAISFEHVLQSSENKVAARIAKLRHDQSTVTRQVWAHSKQLNLWDARAGLQEELRTLTATLQSSKFGIKGLINRMIGNAARPSHADTAPGGDLRESIALLETGIAEIERRLTASDRADIERILAELGDRQRDLTTAILLLEKFLRELRVNLLSHARIVAATATQAFLRAHELSGFDTVVVDEASMLPLPLLYRLCGMAKHSVVIAGDFRQLPPISVSRSEIVARWYSRDIFDSAGIVQAVNEGRALPHLAKLTTQFRSCEQLCALINERFYGGDLTSRSAHREPTTFPPSMAFLSDHPLVLIDSSDLAPVGQNVGRSRANLMHALLIRRICLSLQAGASDGLQPQVGVIAPYRAQVELIEELLNEAGLHGFSVGTVHRFQGEERKVIVLDLTESSPHSLGSFLSATTLKETGARLLNVALSRAQSNLLVVANLAFLRSATRPTQIIHGVLADLERSALKLRSSELLAPLQFAPQPSAQLLKPSAFAFQGFDELTLVPALLSDMRDASRTITIVSAHLSLTGVATFIDLLRRKRKQKVELRVVVAPPASRDATATVSSHEQACASLVAVGVSVLEQRTIRSNLVCIDDEVVWLGRLNPLSHQGIRGQLMTRAVSRVAARLALEAIVEPSTSRPGASRAVNV